VALIIAAVASVPMHLIARRRKWEHDPTAHLRAPFRLVVLTVLLWVAVTATFPRGAAESPERAWFDGTVFVLRMLAIAFAAWLIVRFVGFLFDQALNRYRTDVTDNRVARRVRTQLLILRRVASAVIVVLAVGAILLTFPGAQAVGASILASAGLASVVAGLAAQSTLANVFAGLQLAFSDAIRVDDVVIAEEYWGRIEEITLTYVVVHVWDDRRLVLPSTYFTTTPFENWTRRNSELLGAVEFDLDWRVDPHGMREKLVEVVENTTLWDGRTQVLQITDATGGVVRVRVLVSAADAGDLFDLRCLVREELVAWVNDSNPTGLPRERVQMLDDQGLRAAAPTARPRREHEGLFSGSAGAEERGAMFTQSIPLPEQQHAESADVQRPPRGDD